MAKTPVYTQINMLLSMFDSHLKSTTHTINLKPISHTEPVKILCTMGLYEWVPVRWCWDCGLTVSVSVARDEAWSCESCSTVSVVPGSRRCSGCSSAAVSSYGCFSEWGGEMTTRGASNILPNQQRHNFLWFWLKKTASNRAEEQFRP